LLVSRWIVVALERTHALHDAAFTFRPRWQGIPRTTTGLGMVPYLPRMFVSRGTFVHILCVGRYVGIARC
jgi:hypothetical protein